ncbi:MAG: hypothetical protein M1830_005238, partial [Pleopsidium flavum]
IYLNLLILEASLRSQYLTLRARRRQHTFFLLLLTSWIAYFFYALFLRPREDGRGLGGSVYWVVEIAEKVALMGGMVTGILIWGTGQWQRGVRWPRRWVGIANRGLRVMNTKIVVVTGPWWREMLSHLSFLFPYSSFFPSPGSSYHYVDRGLEKSSHYTASYGNPGSGNVHREEDLAPGGDYIKLLLLPKPFSPDFRENWELYRTEYWERENERRAQLRQRVKKRQREVAREQGGWLWWTGWRGWKRTKGMGGRGGDIERTQHHQHHPEKDTKRLSGLHSDSLSRSSSRSTTPSHPDAEVRPTSERLRRGSSTSSVGERRRKIKSTPSTGSVRAPRLTHANPQPPSSVSATSPYRHTQAGGNMNMGSGNDSDQSVTPTFEESEALTMTTPASEKHN